MLPLVAHDLTSLSRMTTAESGSLGREENYSKQWSWPWPAWSREILGISPCFLNDYQTLVIECWCKVLPAIYNTRQVVPILHTNTSWNHFQFFARCPPGAKLTSLLLWSRWMLSEASREYNLGRWKPVSQRLQGSNRFGILPSILPQCSETRGCNPMWHTSWGPTRWKGAVPSFLFS